MEAAAAFWSPFFSAGVWVFLGLQLPFSPCFLPGVSSKPGQQALALESFLPVASFLADGSPGVFFVSAPVMWWRKAAVLVFADLVVPLGGDFFAAAFFASAFFAGDFFADVFFAADSLDADFLAVVMECKRCCRPGLPSQSRCIFPALAES